MILKNNCCDGIYNSFDVHFTSLCDNKCKHCVDMQYAGLGIKKPDVKAITETIINNCEGVDDILFLGGEPYLFLDELLESVKILKEKTDLKLFVTTAMPKTCYDNRDVFIELLSYLDGLNISVQDYREDVADEIRNVGKSTYDRQSFYASLPMKEKIRINLNIVKPFLHTRGAITNCLRHYDKMGFNSIKISEIQHGKDYFVSFEDLFNIKMKSPYAYGCQTYLDMDKILPNFNTPVLLKRSCFACEETLKAGVMDGVKVLSKVFSRPKNKYGVIYGNGSLEKGWI